MKILVISLHCCIRVLKESFALLQAGHDLHFFQHHFSIKEFIPAVPECSFWSSNDDFIVKLKALKKRGFDAVHVHNEPSWMGWVTKEVFGDTPVIFDAHDLYAVRDGRPREHEIKSFQTCDGFIFPSISYRDIAKEKFKIEKPTEVIYSKPFPKYATMPSLPRLGGIVFQGGIEGKTNWYWKNYIKTAKEFTRNNIAFSIYLSGGRRLGDYEGTGIMLHGTLPYSKMMQNLTRYDWGYSAAGKRAPQWDAAMPNKLFEYLAVGLPVLAHKGTESGDFVEHNDCGMTFNDISEIPNIYNLHEEYREKLKDRRQEFTFDTEIEKLQDFYEAVL